MITWDIETREYCLSFGPDGLNSGLVEVPFDVYTSEELEFGTPFRLEECPICGSIVLCSSGCCAREICSHEGDESLDSAHRTCEEIAGPVCSGCEESRVWDSYNGSLCIACVEDDEYWS
jgi:hypothetical protein